MEIPQHIIDRFWSKVEKTDYCWLWTAGKTTDGYGAWTYKVQDKSQWFRAHRFAWLVTHGAPKKPEFHHICNTRLCVRPDHLRAVTRKEHMWLTPGSYGYKWKHRTHCQEGHELSVENCLPSALKNGYRRCRICSSEASRKWRTANPEKMKAAVRNWTERNHDRKLRADREYHRRVKAQKLAQASID